MTLLDTRPDVAGFQRRELALAVRAADDESRTIEGIAVPWEQETSIGGWYREKFRAGSVQDSAGALLFYRHDEPIGKIISAEDTDEGWKIRARISKTARGDEAYELARDGVLSKLSIGFESIEYEVDEETEVVTRTKVRVREVSLVPIPAYDGAEVTNVRHSHTNNKEKNPVETNIKEPAIVEIREELAELGRKFDGFELALDRRDDEPEIDHRSVGQILKAIVAGDERTIARVNEIQGRAFDGGVAGGTTANHIVKDAWVGDLTKLIDGSDYLGSIFSTGALPAEGNNIEYGELLSNSIAVAEQANEADNLTFGKVTTTTKTAPVKTIGGYSALSVQAIERSSVGVLDLTMRALALAAAKHSKTDLRTFYGTQHAAQVAAGNVVAVPATAASWVDWLDALVDAAEKFDDLSLPIDALVTDKATFKELVALEAGDGRPVLLVDGAGNNNVGTLNVKGLTGSLASLRVACDPKLGANKSAFVNGDAIRVYKSGVTRLQDSNIINLTRAFSVYFYKATAAEIPDAIVPVNRTA